MHVGPQGQLMQRASFTQYRVSFDKDVMTTLESNEHVKAVEVDGEVKAF